jgi:hypothetical protein
MRIETFGTGLEADRERIIGIRDVALALRQVADIPHKAGGQNIEEAVHAELAELGKIYQVIALGKEASGEEAAEAAEQENQRGATLPGLGDLLDDVDMRRRLVRGAILPRRVINVQSLSLGDKTPS